MVLVWSLDRWGRSVADLLATLQELEHLVRLCFAQHKRTYVALKVMLRRFRLQAFLLARPHCVLKITHPIRIVFGQRLFYYTDN